MPAIKKSNQRIIIIGNSGSGKSWTGKNLSQNLTIPIFHMDEIWFEKGRWDEGGDSTFIRKRQLEDINNDVQNIVIQDEWILEGVFGLIANKAFSFATTLIWLNLPWEECHKNLRQRGPQFEAFILPHERETSQQNLIKWASTHYSRKDHMSEYFFKEIFKRFPNDKLQLHSRSQIINFISGIEK